MIIDAFPVAALDPFILEAITSNMNIGLRLTSSEKATTDEVTFNGHKTSNIILVVRKQRAKRLVVSALILAPEAHRFVPVQMVSTTTNADPVFDGLLAPTNHIPLTNPSQIKGVKVSTKIETELKPDAGKVEAVAVVGKQTSTFWKFAKEPPWGDIGADELYKPCYR